MSNKKDSTKKDSTLPPVTIEVGVYWYESEDGKIVFDEEEMQKEFEFKLKKIIENFN